MPVQPRRARSVHPVAWWIWAIGMAAAASLTTNPLLLGLVLAVVGLVVAGRRSDEPWARGYRTYLLLGVVAIAIRIGFRALLGGGDGTTVLLRLPELPLPDGAGFRIGGAVTLEGLIGAAVDGLRLATLLACVGAANVLADPRRLLRSVPAALHEIGVAVTVALTVAPQLVDSGLRVRRAQRLRGVSGSGRRHRRAVHLLRRIAVPVLADALDRSLSLAASMDARGYGRTHGASVASRRLAGASTLAGLCGLCVGTYGLLDASAPRALGMPALALGLVLAIGGIALGGRGVRRTRYRPDPWRPIEWAVAGSGLVTGAIVILASGLDVGLLHPSTNPLAWPPVPLLASAGVLIGLVPCIAAPRTVPTRSELGPHVELVDDLALAVGALRRGPA